MGRGSCEGSGLTPERASEIYHEARLKAMLEAAQYTKPVVQAECDRKGWEAVIEAVRHETDSEFVRKILDMGLTGG